MALGDPATFMISLCKGLQGYSCPPDWVDTLKERDIEKEKANRYIYVQNANFRTGKSHSGRLHTSCLAVLVCRIATAEFLFL